MNKILIANRGEIAIRIMKTASKMGIKTVAVYSDADANSLHVQVADEAYHIGPSASAESYLKMDKLIEVAKATACEGIHPGYGFLSENATFAKMVTDAGIQFIGPSPHSIKIMGSKLAAKDAVKQFDIPLVPGTDHALTDIAEGKRLSKEIGFPVLIKASAGGGGKGMRLVENEEEFEEKLQLAQSEAQSSFGDAAVFIEKYITSPRHIEVQVLFDEHGNGVHLFERECSIQRRHQKVIEEAPSPKIDAKTRAEIGAIALDVARSCDYHGAGTVEFIMDADGKCYFLEMNTRLQVEHPVTEMITGVDLVEQQIKVARGEKLSLNQDELNITGHSIELRIYAEDARNNFAPSIGTLSTYQLPKGEGIRVDNGFEEGMEIPIYYDPMIAKLVVWAPNRPQAIAKLKRAIHDYKIEGIESTLELASFVLKHNDFADGSYDTKFIPQYIDSFLNNDHQKSQIEIAAKVAVMHWENYKQQVRVPKV